MLDKEHGSTRSLDSSDQIIYLLGEIRGHKVVIACLPNQSGTAMAATVATQMLRSFPSIKFGLMVGIGGGIPSAKADIRLGDVVVSRPDDAFGGVVQYDLGKKLHGGRFQRTGSLNKPPTVLLSALNMIQSKHERRRPKLGTFCSETLQRIPDMREDYDRPKQEDNLYLPDYEHDDRNHGYDNCEKCDLSKLQPRPQHRSSPTEPRIHYGTIASGNMIIKDGVSRDKLSKELNGVLSVEIEAAGLMDHFPCLVIRGISDYADSHKNDCWQKYAAMTAAAYAKELLNFISNSDVEKAVAAKQIVPITEQSPAALGRPSMGTMTGSDSVLSELQPPLLQQGAFPSDQYPSGAGWQSAHRTVSQYDQSLPQPRQPPRAHPASPPNQYPLALGGLPALSRPAANQLPHGVAPSTHPQPRPTPKAIRHSNSDSRRPGGNVQGSGGTHRKAVGSPPRQNVGYSQASKMVYPQPTRPSHSRSSGAPIHHYPNPPILLRPLSGQRHDSKQSSSRCIPDSRTTYIYGSPSVELTPNGAPKPSKEPSETGSRHSFSSSSVTSSEVSNNEVS